MMNIPRDMQEDAMERLVSIKWVPVCTAAACMLMVSFVAAARPVTIIPKTNHSALTMSTDGSYGFQVVPGTPLKVELVGPGSLTLTVRLNHLRKRSTYKGVFEIRRFKKRIKRSKLNLFRSRVGHYTEDKSINPSTPKIFKVKVPKGVQHYTFTLRGKRGVSMTLGIEYDSKADQSAVESGDELALVPLTAPGGDFPPEDDIGLVPLAPVGPTGGDKPGDKPVVVASADPDPMAPVPLKPDPPVKPVLADKPIVDKPKPIVVPKPVEDPKPAPLVADAPKPDPAPRSARKVETIEPLSKDPTEVEQKAPETSEPFLSIGAKLGQISAIEGLGSTSFTAAIDLRYVLPVFSGRLSFGVEAGYHQYAASLGYDNSSTRTAIDVLVVPISVQMFYRIPLGTFIEPYVGAGADVLLGWAEVAYESDPDSATSDSAVGFGGHVTLGAEAKLGPGYLLVEVRAGMSKMDLGVVDNINVSGLASVAGYRFEF